MELTILLFALLPALPHAIATAFQFKPAPTTVLANTAVCLESAPTITAGPSHDDLRRQTNNNDVCGWINGNAASEVSCPANFYCATQSTFVGCCAVTSCAGIVTSCYDILGPICDAACHNNVGNLVCPASLPYCGTYLYPGGSVGYGCRDATGYTVSVLLGASTSDGGHLTLSSSSSSSTSPTSISTIFSTMSAIPTPTPTPIEKKGGLGGGPIAGIVLGTIAVLALVGALIFWMIMTRRRHQPKEQQDTYQMQSPTGSSGQKYPISSGFYIIPKDEPRGGSPAGHASPTSFIGSDLSGHTQRNSQPVEYTGPTMPEVHGDPAH